MIGELFRLESCEVVGQQQNVESAMIRCSAALSPVMESAIFAAHFPGRPVVPGACLVAVVSELMSRVTGNGWQLKEIKNVKFISLIEPTAETKVTVDIDIDTVSRKAKALVSNNGNVCCKMSLLFCDGALHTDTDIQ